MKQPKYYMQTDLKWATKPYTVTGNKTQTIASSGCGPTCAAMVLAEFVNPNITPVDTVCMSIKNGFRTPNDGTSWGFYSWIAKQYKLELQQTSDFNVFIKALQEGALAICSMGRKSATERGFFTSGGHYILAWGIDQKGIYANDPISKYRTCVPVSPDVWKTQCKQYFIFNKREAQPVEKPIDYIQAIDILAKIPSGQYKVINSSDSLKKDLEQSTISTDRVKSLLINMANANALKGAK